jgi:hypothetical protein
MDSGTYMHDAAIKRIMEAMMGQGGQPQPQQGGMSGGFMGMMGGQPQGFASMLGKPQGFAQMLGKPQGFAGAAMDLFKG